MSTSRQDFSPEVDRIRNFLMESGWVRHGESSTLDFFYPPEDLGIKGKYSIALPKDPGRQGVGGLLSRAVNALTDIYGFQFTSLYDQIASRPGIDGSALFSFRFVDDETSQGTIPLDGLSAFLDYVRKSIYRAVKFKIDGSSDAPANDAAEGLTRNTKFLQTAQGSFVTRIEVPFVWLKQADLFGAAPISSHEVCSHILSSLQFINGRVLDDQVSNDSDVLLAESLSLFDPGLLEAYAKMLLEPAVDQIDIAMQIGSQTRTSTTGHLSHGKITMLGDFVRFFRDNFYDEDKIDVIGRIVELRSRDPSGDSNHVRLIADFHGDQAYFSLLLNYDQYQVAVDAHRNNLAVRVSGVGTRLKTQVRVNKVESFTISR